jgi:hypothetical protein
MFLAQSEQAMTVSGGANLRITAVATLTTRPFAEPLSLSLPATAHRFGHAISPACSGAHRRLPLHLSTPRLSSFLLSTTPFSSSLTADRVTRPTVHIL